MSATDHSRAAGVLLLCRAEPGRVRPSAQLLNEPLLLVPAGEGWSALIPGKDSWRTEGTDLATATAGWAHALAVAEQWPVVGLWWDAHGAGFVVAAGFRRTVGYTWLADGTPHGEEAAMTALRARTGLDPVLDGAALDGLTRPDTDADAASRVLGLIAVLSRTGLNLVPGLAPGVPADGLRAAAGAHPLAEAVDWPGWREAVRTGLLDAESGRLGAWTRGPRARALGAAEVAAGASLALWGRWSGRRGVAAVGAVVLADGALTLAYDWWRGRA
ncbi:hypothetical protein FGW37_22200 [Streptomyces rectiverticillatus]|uniref:hypothetical protein n=1 Tax=Streptomyces rectiverticillatus TaxID=173860 RepID=UPI0015C3C403|nr:hypothetical protein [Streptomyces rectiverticillatus]QLE73933.1 hypothetical protein FGW37_22200 [Streptomyces rectiverticillatus]